MTQPRRGLGRGLDALFGGATSAPPAPPPERQHESPPPPTGAPPPPPAAEPRSLAPLVPELAGAPSIVPDPGQQAAPAPAYREPIDLPVAPPQPTARYNLPVLEAISPPIVIAQPATFEVAPPYEPPAALPPPEPQRVAETPPPIAPVAPVVAPTAVRPQLAPRGTGANEVDIDLISPNPEQPRTNFEPEKLRELSDSIMEHGIIQPLIVSHDPDGGFRLIAGERRLQAARLAGLNTVPVVIRDAVDAELLEIALIENIQRADLNAIEEAMAYRRLTEEYGLTQEEAAKRVGKSRAAVANALRLLQLEPEIRRSLVAGEITEGHARALLGLSDSRGRMSAWREVVKRALTVRDTEGLVRRALNAEPATQATPGAATARRDANIADIEARLRRALSTRVSVVPQRRGARITIDCFSSEEFEHVVEYLLGNEE